MRHKETHTKLRLLEMLNDEYELLEMTPYSNDRTCILSRIKMLEELLDNLKIVD